MTKKCSKCGVDKPLELFNKRKDVKSGYDSRCIDCIKQYRIDNKEKIREKKRKYYQDNKDKIKEKVRKRYISKKEDVLNYQKDYYKKNKESINKRNKEYHKRTREERNKYNREKRAIPINKLKHNISKRIWEACKKKGFKKNNKTSDILGCEWDIFKTHIELKFTEGMSWENYGEWHIDHVKPISLAKTEEEVYELNHYTNLQPLWAEDNFKKSNKWI